MSRAFTDCRHFTCTVDHHCPADTPCATNVNAAALRLALPPPPPLFLHTPIIAVNHVACVSGRLHGAISLS